MTIALWPDNLLAGAQEGVAVAKRQVLTLTPALSDRDFLDLGLTFDPVTETWGVSIPGGASIKLHRSGNYDIRASASGRYERRCARRAAKVAQPS